MYYIFLTTIDGNEKPVNILAIQRLINYRKGFGYSPNYDYDEEMEKIKVGLSKINTTLVYLDGEGLYVRETIPEIEEMIKQLNQTRNEK